MHNENDDDLKLCVEELRKVSEILWFKEKVSVSFQTYHFQKVLTGGSYNMIRNHIYKI